MHTEQSFVNIFSCARRYLPETEENNFSKFGNFFRSLCVTSFKNTYRNVMAQSISNLQSKTPYIPKQTLLIEKKDCFRKKIYSRFDVSEWECKLFSSEFLLFFPLYLDLGLHKQQEKTQRTYRILRLFRP